MNHTYDAIVVGLGGMGSAAAYHLAVRGKRVLGLERFGAAHDRGSSHGGSRIIRQAYHEDVHYVPLVQRAYELWRKLEKDSGTDLLHITGGLLLGAAESAVVSGSLQSARQHNLPFDFLEAGDLRSRFPALKPRERDCAVFEREAGFLRPELAVQTHLQLASQHGADLHFEEPITHWEVSSSGRVRVRTPRTTYEAERLIMAPGAWAPDILRDLGIDLQVRRHVMCWFAPQGGIEPFLPDRFPIYVWQADTERIFYGFPATDGPSAGVKAAVHSGGELCSADAINRDTSTGDIEEIREYLAEFIPLLNGPVIQTSVCMYTLTPDENFVVAVHPDFPQVVVACGFSGHGFKFTSVIGKILSNLAIDGAAGYPIDFLSPNRFRVAPTN